MFASPINGRTKVVERRRNRWPTLDNLGWCVSSGIGGKCGLKYAGAEDPIGMQWMHGRPATGLPAVRRVRFQEQAQTTGESVAPGLPSLPLTSLIEFGSLKTDLLAQAARLASRKEPPFVERHPLMPFSPCKRTVARPGITSMCFIHPMGSHDSLRGRCSPFLFLKESIMSESRFYDLHVTGLGYLNRVRLVKPNKG